MDIAKLTADQITKLAESEKKQGDRAQASLAKLAKSAAEFAKSAKVVADISKKNPEL